METTEASTCSAETLAANKAALTKMLSAPSCDVAGTRKLGLELERFVIDRDANRTVAYVDEPGVHELLSHWVRFFSPAEQVFIDGHLFGYAGTYEVEGERVGISISLEPGSQLEASVGPSEHVWVLLGALETFDAQFAELTRELGVRWELVPNGYNPIVSAPTEVPLIDKERYHLMDAYLSGTGRYARDMMRGTTSAQVSIDLACGHGGPETYQLAVALGPMLSFLCDNAPHWRGLSAADTPRMAHARIWEQVDPTRCGIVPGTFDKDFGAATYVDWLCGVSPILFTDAEGKTTSTGTATEADILSRRLLTKAELAHMVSMVFPECRLKGFAELRTTDSLPPAQSAALAAFVKGLFYDPAVGDEVSALVLPGISVRDVRDAWSELKASGWDATVYGQPATELVDNLVTLSRKGLANDRDLALLEPLTSLWANRHVPRDLAE